MWTASNLVLKMAEGDYGIKLPTVIKGATLDQSDSIRVTLKKEVNGPAILVKDYVGIEDNTIGLELTEAESELFPVGNYVYSIDWYQSGNFMCNLVPFSLFVVVDKA